MPEYVFLIRTSDGVVAIADKNDSRNQITGIIGINKNTIALVFSGLQSFKKFRDNYFKDITDDDDIIKICNVANDAFKNQDDGFEQTDLSFTIISFIKDQGPLIYGFDYKNKLCNEEIYKKYFSSDTHQDIVQYLVNKVYSEHMLIDELTKLSSFVILQCIKIFQIGTDLDFVTLSKKETKWLSTEEIKEQLHIQEKVDHKLKKIFSDFFLNEVNTR